MCAALFYNFRLAYIAGQGGEYILCDIGERITKRFKGGDEDTHA